MADLVAELLGNAVCFSLPLRTSFRGVERREGLLIHGPSGWGEFAPFVEYDDVTAARWLASAVDAAYGTWPAPHRSSVPVNAIVPATDPATARAMAERAYREDGCTTVKVKVAERGQTLDDDLARVSAVLDGLRAAGVAEPRIRVDANGAWSVNDARVAIRELEAAVGGLEYVEQPCATLAELAQLRDSVAAPVAADESIRTAGDPLRAVRSGAVDVIVLKVPPMGGVGLALTVAEAAGVPVVVSGAMDSSIGLSAGLALAAALRDLPYACGLGTGALLAEDLLPAPVRPRHGALPVRRWKPYPPLLRQACAAVSRERERWWRDRLVRAWDAGADLLVGPLVRGSFA